MTHCPFRRTCIDTVKSDSPYISLSVHTFVLSFYTYFLQIRVCEFSTSQFQLYPYFKGGNFKYWSTSIMGFLCYL